MTPLSKSKRKELEAFLAETRIALEESSWAGIKDTPGFTVAMVATAPTSDGLVEEVLHVVSGRKFAKAAKAAFKASSATKKSHTVDETRSLSLSSVRDEPLVVMRELYGTGLSEDRCRELLWAEIVEEEEPGGYESAEPVVVKSSDALPDDEFWSLIGVLRGGTDDDDIERLSTLLARRPEADILAFAETLALKVAALDKPQPERSLSAGPTAYLSDDAFLDVCLGVVAAGEAAYAKAVVGGRVNEDEWEEGELLQSVADDALAAQRGYPVLIETSMSSDAGSTEILAEQSLPDDDEPEEQFFADWEFSLSHIVRLGINGPSGFEILTVLFEVAPSQGEDRGSEIANAFASESGGSIVGDPVVINTKSARNVLVDGEDLIVVRRVPREYMVPQN